MSCDHYYYGVSEHFIALEKTPYTFSSIQLLSHVQLSSHGWENWSPEGSRGVQQMEQGFLMMVHL